MANLDCYAARLLDIAIGTFLLVMGFIFVGLGFTFIPVVALFLGIPPFIISSRFLFAPRDKICYIS